MVGSAENFENSTYYKRVLSVFDSLPDEDAKRAFVSALIKCFDLNEGRPVHPVDAANGHGFNKRKIHDYKFVMAKKHAIEFFVQEVGWPGVSVRDVRALTSDQYNQLFGRDAFYRGRSAFWYSLAEWILLLELSGKPPLPQRIREFAENNNLL